MNQPILFEEEQKFTQWWLWIFLIALSFFALAGAYQQLILGVPYGSKPMSDLGMIFFVIFVIAFVGMFYLMTLKTEITKDEIRVRFFPLTHKIIAWDEVEKAEVVMYGFVGGWGIRLWTKYGTVYNIGGNKGLALQLKSGKKYLIGTQKEEEMKSLLRKLSAK